MREAHSISSRARSLINSANAGRRGFWTPARIHLLRRRWAEQAFVASIAAEIGHGCTRNMVISKANRLKLGGRKDWARFGATRRRPIRVQRETTAAVQP